MRPAGAVPALLAVALAACLAHPTHHCATADDCAAGEQCVPVTADDRRCAAASAACGSGLAWSDDAGDLAGACVDGEPPAAWNPCFPQAAPTVDDACTAAVCAHDDRCCTREWSDTCVHEADQRCGSTCGAVAAFVGADETWVGVWDGTAYAPLWSDVITGHEIHAAAWGDYDGDLRPDLATCEAGSVPGAAIRIYHNDGASFSLEKAAESGTDCWDIDWVDLDADGDLDVAVPGAYEMRWIENDHGLWAPPAQAVATGYVDNADWADVDGDGRLDAAVGRYADSLLVQHNTPGGFTTWYDSGDAAAQPRYIDVTWGDVDEAGGLDLLVSGDGFLRVLPNTADAAFSPAAPTLERTGTDSIGATFADVDEDGDLDVVAAAFSTPLRVYRNDHVGGGAGFTTTPLWESAVQPFVDGVVNGGLALGDADGDRHLDLAACASGDFCQLWLGAGDGSFTRAWDPTGDRHLFDVALTGDWR